MIYCLFFEETLEKRKKEFNTFIDLYKYVKENNIKGYTWSVKNNCSN